MSNTPNPKFDPYHKWLGIPEGKRPPNYYMLLGISPKESDREVIESAIERRRSYVSQHLKTEHRKWASRIIYEIDEAGVYLLDPFLRKEYDLKLAKLRARKKITRNSSAILMPGETPTHQLDEDSDFVPTYLKIVSILTVSFMVMAVFSFMLPWQEVVFGPPEEEIPDQNNAMAINAPMIPTALKDQKNKAPLPKEITNSIGMKFTLVPAGEFVMGNVDNVEWAKAGPKHRVKITRTFYMGIYEVTQAEYLKVMGDNPSRFQSDPNLPVESVNWDMVQSFISKLSEAEEEVKAGRTYRLPTEAEWEYACRAGTSTPYHYGNSLSSLQANFNGDYPGGNAVKGPYLRKTAKVGSYKPNAFGLYDMHGNVFEFVSDWYGEDYYSNSPLEDPQGPSFGTEGIARGGGWASWAPASGMKVNGPRSTAASELGFRLICETSKTKNNSENGNTVSKQKKPTPDKPSNNNSSIQVKKSSSPKSTKPLPETIEHKIAKWVFSNGGKMKIKYNTFERDASAFYQLPESSFQIEGITLKDLKNIHDKDLVNIKDAKDITYLSLMGSGVSNNGLRQITGFKKLSSLNVAGTRVSDSGLKHLSGIASLEELYFGGCPIRGDGLVHLKGLYNLKLLGLIGTQLTDKGLPHISKMKSLTELRLRDTQVSNFGAKHLVGLTNLRILDFTNTKVSKTTIMQLQRVLPNCQIKK